MSGAPLKALKDDHARRTAIGALDRSLLVEAGAGSGKTAVIAGRIAMLLASGVAPKSIAAVTFTELAASELQARVHDFVGRLTAGDVPPEMRVALPDGLPVAQAATLALAVATVDDMACSTIHGFCQRLITPYPVEAGIDPGAGIVDRGRGDLAFLEVVDGWLRERLSTDEGGLLAELVVHEPAAGLALVRTVLAELRKSRTIVRHLVAPIPPLVAAFQEAAAALTALVETAGAEDDGTVAIAARFAELSQAVAVGSEDSASLVRLVTTRPHDDLLTEKGKFYKYQRKGKWVEAAKRAGLSKADGERLCAVASGLYEACCSTWDGLLQAVAACVLDGLIGEVAPAIERFHEHKRSSALLDFDDLLHAARDLLRDHEDVRRALSLRHAHVLVDEFQDTDPLQAEIFWRLCGDPAPGADPEDWAAYRIRPGALFLVGDPKQAIYRFRGADVTAYVAARDAFASGGEGSVLSIATNFRSCASILGYVNGRFQHALSADGQPGFTPLDPFHPDREAGPCIAALDVAVADEKGKASAERKRDGEAEAVAAMCARLIGNDRILDHTTGEYRFCRPGDIALLAPTGSELWRYEEALERRGIPVATQAGKGFYKRQEVQDLIALTRVLADRHDTLALGALLRGPLVGLTEEALLDIVWALPRDADDPTTLPRFDVGVDVQLVTHPLARDVLQRIQTLRRSGHATTPHNLLSQAVDVLRVRPTLLQRHGGQAERALSNVDLFLGLSRDFAVRGLRAFATAVTAAWTDEDRAVEGRPDAQEEAVALYTMHAAKGLEWPIVVPINTMTAVKATESIVTDRRAGRLLCPVVGAHPAGYEEARDAETEERERERIRLWYVAATRAREMLVLPRLDVAGAKNTWIELLDLALSDLPALDLSELPSASGEGQADVVNLQTREVFAAEAAAISGLRQRLEWSAPSRDEGASKSVVQSEAPVLTVPGLDAGEPVDGGVSRAVQGGRERGLVIHKMLEEVLTGEIDEAMATLTARATVLIEMLGLMPTMRPEEGPCAAEIAGCVARAFALQEVATLRNALKPEFPVLASSVMDDVERLTAGITDAVTIGTDGKPDVIVDWKSDVEPDAEAIFRYRVQVGSYMQAMGACRGMIVFVTSGVVVTV